jgi:hypothetical protein
MNSIHVGRAGKLMLGAILFGLFIVFLGIVFAPRREPDLLTSSPKGIFDEIVFDKLISDPIACPNPVLTSTSGQMNRLADYRGNVIILRFTRFHPQDLASLRYLDSLLGRFKGDGFRLFFIYELGKTDVRTSHDPQSWNTPIIEDDGYIASLFHAGLNDLILIDRSYSIAVKHNELNDRTVYHLLCRHLFGSLVAPAAISEIEFVELLQSLSFINVRNNQREYLHDLMGDTAVALTLFISPCMYCQLQQRIDLNENLLSNVAPDNLTPVFLLGPGQPLGAAGEWTAKYFRNSKIIVGVIEDSDFQNKMKSHLIFKYYIDPYMVIFDKKGGLVFSEEPRDRIRLSQTFLKSFLK